MLLEVKDLNSFSGISQVLQGISLDVEKTKIVSLLGRNGMGKAHIGFAGTREELEAQPETKAKYLEV